MNEHWAELHMKEIKGEDDANARQIEFQTKKLMTVAKSKYYMLKVNYPKLAEVIDNEPLITEEAIEDSIRQQEEQLSQKKDDVN